ncbi:hypothetical protein Bca52824_039273 [Brassica carinata]|uniref:Wall-associated receptor kinase domain-containing protein n=1 Tax=Brassica carinata TaxID=52824 RepID=A0A8X7UVT5_BRACI|nr:hypothetical protein Bca52824_039273 [Brassica carinata]
MNLKESTRESTRFVVYVCGRERERECNRAGVRVPYPFGIGKGCYKSKWFEVVCNHSLHLSFPFLPSIGLDVISFSLTDDFIYEDRSHKSNGFQIQSPRKTSGCSYGKKDVQSLNLTGSPFFISDNNKFTAVGCNIKAMMVGTGPQIVGCEARCGKETRYYKDADKSCVGYKCCQTKIPPGLQVYDSTVEKLEPCKNVCQEAYLSREDFSTYTLTSPDLTENVIVTMDLEWRLEVPPNIVPKSSHCEISTSLIRTDDQYKYQCRCRSGYEGNPYLPGGCQGGTLSSGLFLIAVERGGYARLIKSRKQPSRRGSSSNEMEVCY